MATIRTPPRTRSASRRAPPAEAPPPTTGLNSPGRQLRGRHSLSDLHATQPPAYTDEPEEVSVDEPSHGELTEEPSVDDPESARATPRGNIRSTDERAPTGRNRSDD